LAGHCRPQAETFRGASGDVGVEPKKPARVVERYGRRVELWDVGALRFSDSYEAPVRVVQVRESWTQREQHGPEWVWNAGTHGLQKTLADMEGVRLS